MDFTTIVGIENSGFTGFKTIKELFWDSKTIPDLKGVYMVLNIAKQPTEFLQTGTGGFFKGKDPNVPINELKSNWVNDTIVVYIGKAGRVNGKATLRSRLYQYIRFGQGANVGHYGGRYIWQIKGSENLILCWKPLQNDDPSVVESELIAEFYSVYFKRPFANLRN